MPVRKISNLNLFPTTLQRFRHFLPEWALPWIKTRKIALVTKVFLRLSNKRLRWKAQLFLIMFDFSKTFTNKKPNNRFLGAAFIFDDDEGAYEPKNRFFWFLLVKVFDTSNIIKNSWAFQRNHLFNNRRKTVVTRAIFRVFIHGRAHSGKKCRNRCKFVGNELKVIIFRTGIPRLVNYTIFQTNLKSSKNCTL